MPFSIAGDGDQLALFRRLCCRYRIATDVSKPHLLGVIGRVYCSGQPELCYDVQRYDKSVYLRVEEARRCLVRSTMVTPVYAEREIAMVEVLHHATYVMFSEIISRLSRCLEVRLRQDCSRGSVGGGRATDEVVTPAEHRWWIRCLEPRAWLRFTAAEALRSQCQSVQLYMADMDICNLQLGLRNWGVESGPMTGETLVQAASEVGQEGDAVLAGPGPSAGAAAEGNEHKTGDLTSSGLDVLNSLPPTLSPMPGNEVPQPEQIDLLDDDDDGEDTDNKKNGTLHTQGAKVEANGDGRQLERSGSCGRSNKIDNQLEGGAVKGISLKDHEAQIRKLDDVAARLGVHSVTLKQTCQRNGRSRWPSRQTPKLHKAWPQTGYQGSPPPLLMRKASARSLVSKNARKLTFSQKAGVTSFLCLIAYDFEPIVWASLDCCDSHRYW
ncbi:unnamed protein product [Ostreobium quekettii]|uniref:RWP-RK domain-containing protein n=1 Tax=Ostreobium quekettii TaxID=121088 RepID=A0A8S1INV1_9CHLO|nr:unnamed protein product [Ostreobium quekettii]